MGVLAKKCLEIFKHNYQKILFFCLISFLVSIPGTQIKVSGLLPNLCITLTQYTITTFCALAIIFLSSAETNPGSNISFSDTLLITKSKLPIFLLYSTLSSLIVGIGFTLLIIPGVYLVAIFFFVPMVAVIETPIKRSPITMCKQLPKPVLWQILRTIIVYLAITLPINILIARILHANAIFWGYVWFVTFPSYLIFKTVLYEHFRNHVRELPISPDQPLFKPKYVQGIFTGIGLLIVFILLLCTLSAGLLKFVSTSTGGKIKDIVLTIVQRPKYELAPNISIMRPREYAAFKLPGPGSKIRFISFKTEMPDAFAVWNFYDPQASEDMTKTVLKYYSLNSSWNKYFKDFTKEPERTFSAQGREWKLIHLRNPNGINYFHCYTKNRNTIVVLSYYLKSWDAISDDRLLSLVSLFEFNEFPPGTQQSPKAP